MESPTSSPRLLRARLATVSLATALFLLTAPSAAAATVEGRAINADGDPLYKVAVCLGLKSEPSKCMKIRWTKKDGAYAFPGLEPGIDYVVKVNGDRSVAIRKMEVYANYVWTNMEQSVSVAAKKETIVMVDFIGKFNFSNFQRSLNLRAVDFPELSSFDLDRSHVMLKVLLPSKSVDERPETIFLGQVRSASNLDIAASVPLSVSTIRYEIFDGEQSVEGAISLTAN